MNDGEPAIYEQCGLRIRSAVTLHLPPAAGEGWDLDVTMGPALEDPDELPIGDTIAAFDGPDGLWWYRGTATGGGYRIRFRGHGEFVVSPGLDSVEVHPGPPDKHGFLPVLIAGSVMSFVLSLRGSTVLHASAVAVDGAALAFIGQSGRGKSTLAAVMCLHGAELVTDDVLVVEPGPPVMAVGGATELRLRPAAMPLAEIRADAPRRITTDDRLALSLERSPTDRLALAAIVVPSPSREVIEVEVERLPASTALLTMLAFPRINGWSRSDVLTRDFAVLSAVAGGVPVYGVTVPWGPPFDPAVVGALRSLAADTNDG